MYERVLALQAEIGEIVELANSKRPQPNKEGERESNWPFNKCAAEVKWTGKLFHVKTYVMFGTAATERSHKHIQFKSILTITLSTTHASVCNSRRFLSLQGWRLINGEFSVVDYIGRCFCV